MADIELVIRIDKVDYRAIKNKKVAGDLTIPNIFDAIRNGTPLPEKWRLIVDDELEKMIVVRKNATNGDVIKALFPQIEVKTVNLLVDVFYLDSSDRDDNLTFYEDWWNASYKAEREKV